MDLLNSLDNPLLVFIYAVITVFAIAHMAPMYYRETPKIEIAGWWCLGAGAFTVFMFEVHGVASEWGHILFGIGAMFLIIIDTQPQWRPVICDRRKTEKRVDKNCERRGRSRRQDGDACDITGKTWS